MGATENEVGTGLVRYDDMCRAISVCHGADEAKSIRDKAEAIRVYALQAKNIEAERQAAEIRIRAERRWGQIYRDGEKHEGGRPGKNRLPEDTGLETLDDLKVSKAQSSKWQQLAESSDRDFETALNKAGSKGVPTTSGVMRNLGVTLDHDDIPSNPKASNALWVWGRVNQFIENINTLTPKQCAAATDDVMRGDLQTNLPILVKWLRELQREIK